MTSDVYRGPLKTASTNFDHPSHSEQNPVTPSPGGGAIVPGFKPPAPLEAPRFRFRSSTDEMICPACGLPEAPVYASCARKQAMERWATAHLEQAFRDIDNVLGPDWAGRVVREFAEQLPPPPALPRLRVRNPKKQSLVIQEFEKLQSQNPGITHEEAAKLIYAKHRKLWRLSDRTDARNRDSGAAIAAIEKMLQRWKLKERKSLEIGPRLLEAVGADGHFDFFENVR